MRNEDAPKSGRVRSVPMIDQVATALDQLSRRNGWTGEEDLGGVMNDCCQYRALTQITSI